MLEHLVAGIAEGDAVVGHIAQGEGAIPFHCHIVDLNIGFQVAEVVLGRQGVAHLTVAFVIVDGGDLEVVLQVVVIDGKEFHVPHHLGTQELADEAFVLEVLHGEVQGLDPVAAGVVREPVPVLLGRVLADAA